MKHGYYYLITSLPELDLTDKNPTYDLLRFREFIREEIQPQDYALLQVLFYSFDIENLVSLIKPGNISWHPYGQFSREDMQEMLLMPDMMPDFLCAFVDDTQKSWERMGAKKLLNLATTYFIDWSANIPNSFLRKWLSFDQNLKNLLIWLNSYKFGLNPVEEVLGNHYEAIYLRSAKPENIDLSAWDFQFREVLQHYDHPNIALRESIVNEMRWHYLGEITPVDFGIERLLNYAIKLLLINRNFADSDQLGEERLQNLLESLLVNDQVPEKTTQP